MRVGHSRVVSVPGAPLQAVVGLQELTPDEIASLRVSVADEAAWLRAGLKPPVPLADLVVGVENGMDATRKNLRVRSSQAPASGAVDLLLDISSSAGQRQVQVSILVPRGAGADATPASVGGKARGRQRRRRHAQCQAGRHALRHRAAQRGARRFHLPDAGGPVARQSSGLHTEQHESAQGRAETLHSRR